MKTRNQEIMSKAISLSEKLSIQLKSLVQGFLKANKKILFT